MAVEMVKRQENGCRQRMQDPSTSLYLVRQDGDPIIDLEQKLILNFWLKCKLADNDRAHSNHGCGVCHIAGKMCRMEGFLAPHARLLGALCGRHLGRNSSLDKRLVD
jgi:hypothetical protein